MMPAVGLPAVVAIAQHACECCVPSYLQRGFLVRHQESADSVHPTLCSTMLLVESHVSSPMAITQKG
jgi:hypothetical protein